MKYFMIFVFALLCLFGCGEERMEGVLHDLAPPAQDAVTAVREVPPEIQELLWGDRDALLAEAQRAYYTKYIDAGGVAIIGNSLVDDEIFLFARDIVLEMTSKRPEIREKLSPSAGHYQIIVNGRFEDVDDIPEVILDSIHQSKERSHCSGSADYCVSKLFGHPYPPGGGPYPRMMATFVHEFAHAIERAIITLDPTFEERLTEAYETAVENGTWAGLYAETNVREYWAEGVSMWFYNTGDAAQPRSDTPTFASYAMFAEHDPRLSELLKEWFHEGSFSGVIDR